MILPYDPSLNEGCAKENNCKTNTPAAPPAEWKVRVLIEAVISVPSYDAATKEEAIKMAKEILNDPALPLSVKIGDIPLECKIVKF